MTAKKGTQKTKKNEMPELKEFKKKTKGQIIGELMVAYQIIDELHGTIIAANLDKIAKANEIRMFEDLVTEISMDLEDILFYSQYEKDRIQGELRRIRRMSQTDLEVLRGIARTLGYLLANSGHPGDLLNAFKEIYDRFMGFGNPKSIETAQEIIANSVRDWMINKDLSKNILQIPSGLPEIPYPPNGEVDIDKALKILDERLKNLSL